MRRLWLAAALLMAGCANVVGPFEYRQPERVDDPLLSISQQQQRARDRLALPEMSGEVLPRTYVELPGPSGR
jgi:hypothetical protein